MDFKALAEKYFKFHNEPLIKIELPSSKFFLEPPNEHKEKIEHYQDILTRSLEYVRVERRCARSKGLWLEDEALCKITKVAGNILKNFGYQDKNGIYLLPEETLFLLEQNKLELTHNTIQFSIYEAYSLMSNHITLKKYRVYKTLVEQGFKLSNKEAIRKFYLGQKENNEDKRNNKKRKTDLRCDESNNNIKRTKRLDDTDNLRNPERSMKSNIEENFTELFENLRKRGPKINPPCEYSRHPDYFGFLPSTRCKHTHDFNLYIRDKIDSEDFDNYEHIPNIFAICTNDNVTFCRYPNVNIPINEINST